MGLNWYGPEVKAKLDSQLVKNLHRAAITYKNEVKRVLSESPPASAPGEPPHRDTGRLRASISHEVDESAKTARVGTNVKYGKFLELGTSKMAARPYLRPTWDRLQEQLKKILATKPS